ncbi:MAG: hypothetical protein HYX48_06110 [Chlamydiales bacterium]|nr:hypothetical protein [Chlamydiales bacterium]
MFKKILCASLLILLASCGGSYLSVRQEWIDARYLASTYVATPDPRQAHPPTGQKLVIHWWVPSALLEKKPQLIIKIIYWNFTEKTITLPLNRRTGYETCSVLDKEYEETQGILTYRVEIVTDDNQIYKEWTHKLWVNLVKIDDQTFPPIENVELEPEERPDDPDAFDEELYAQDPYFEEESELIGKMEKDLFRQSTE